MKKLILIFSVIALTGLAFVFCSQYILDIWTGLNMNDIHSRLIESNKSVWRIETTQIEQSGDIKEIYFYNEALGYVIVSTNTILKTSDGGKNWENVSTLSDFAIDDIFFTTPTEGYCLTNKLSTSSEDNNETHIMKSEDGGKTWVSKYSSNSVALRKIIYTSDGWGIAVGKRRISTPQVDSANFVLLTNDNGQIWTDVSDGLNRVAVNEMGRIQESLTDVTFSKGQGIVVLSSRGKLYNSSNEGKSWNVVSKLFNEPAQTDIRHLGILEDGRFWVAGGTISQEGIWGMTAVTKNYFGWDRYRLNGYYFSDVRFLANNEIIACGATVAHRNTGEENNSDKGVILYSTDGGKDWYIIYESTTSSQFNSISQMSQSKVFVAGTNGEVVSLEKSSDANPTP